MKTIARHFRSLVDSFAESKYKAHFQNNDLGQYKRIYHVHNRKTGGTSINKMFIGLEFESGNDAYNQLAQSPNYRLVSSSGKVFLGWTKRLIEKGNYYYAFSHIPYHELTLPNDTYTISCFRDPAKRVLSHYRMLMEMIENNSKHACLAIESKWMGKGFSYFLQQIPNEHLKAQLYMYSKNYSVAEAIDRLNEISCVFSLSNFDSGIQRINQAIGTTLVPTHTRKTMKQFEPTEAEMQQLREMLTDEYQLMEQVAKMG